MCKICSPVRPVCRGVHHFPIFFREIYFGGKKERKGLHLKFTPNTILLFFFMFVFKNLNNTGTSDKL